MRTWSTRSSLASSVNPSAVSALSSAATSSASVGVEDAIADALRLRSVTLAGRSARRRGTQNGRHPDPALACGAHALEARRAAIDGERRVRSRVEERGTTEPSGRARGCGRGGGGLRPQIQCSHKATTAPGKIVDKTKLQQKTRATFVKHRRYIKRTSRRVTQTRTFPRVEIHSRHPPRTFPPVCGRDASHRFSPRLSVLHAPHPHLSAGTARRRPSLFSPPRRIWRDRRPRAARASPRAPPRVFPGRSSPP